MKPLSRRDFIHTSSAASALIGSGLSLGSSPLSGQVPGPRPPQSPLVSILNPRDRVPLSFIIDDSTCLVNLAHYCIPQFAEVFPDRYQQDWRRLPREIPDAFVRKFGEWCHENGVKGKYSIIPYPACVGWLDRDLPGWSKRDLVQSLDLVRELMVPDWDIHPELMTHTWGIDTRTGRPYADRTEANMENWGFSVGKSTDELADYFSYALRILRNVDLPCQGITTPGGFGNRVLPQLSQATLESCRDVFQTEIPHYFRHLFTDERSVAPRVEYASGLDGPDPRCAVSIIGCTGDWFGGWDGLVPGSVDRFITPDLKGGRLPEVIARGEPAIMVCHWPGIYFNGEEVGFDIFKSIVSRLRQGYDNLMWMKLSEIARYWAARELTRVESVPGRVHFKAPFACPDFTMAIPEPDKARLGRPQLIIPGKPPTFLRPVNQAQSLVSGTSCQEANRRLYCFNLPRGDSTLQLP